MTITVMVKERVERKTEYKLRELIHGVCTPSNAFYGDCGFVTDEVFLIGWEEIAVLGGEESHWSELECPVSVKYWVDLEIVARDIADRKAK